MTVAYTPIMRIIMSVISNECTNHTNTHNILLLLYNFKVASIWSKFLIGIFDKFLLFYKPGLG
jgi:hypothetical protein